MRLPRHVLIVGALVLVACGGDPRYTGCDDEEICPGAAQIDEDTLCGWPGTLYSCAKGSPKSHVMVSCYLSDCSGHPDNSGGIAYWKSTDPEMCQIYREFWLGLTQRCY